MIIDTHAHVFPPLATACGWRTVKDHQNYLGAYMWGMARAGAKRHHEPPPDINFRAGRFGRFLWTEDGVDYYRQFTPPALQNQASPPEYVIAEMVHAGVDMANLQQAKMYGKLNKYIAKCVRKYPNRFVGLAQLDNELEAYKEISKLKRTVKELGFNGMLFEGSMFRVTDNPSGFNVSKFDSFWREVSDLGIAVYWQLVNQTVPAEMYMNLMRIFSAWAKRFPDIPSVLLQGLFAYPFRQENGEVRFPQELFDIFKQPNVYAEVTYGNQAGPMGWDYPFPQAQQLIRQLYEEIGPHKMLWGSDMPMTQRNCTYRQSLTYLKNYCDFIPAKDMELILGGNVARIMKIQTDLPKTPEPILAGAA